MRASVSAAWAATRVMPAARASRATARTASRAASGEPVAWRTRARYGTRAPSDWRAKPNLRGRRVASLELDAGPRRDHPPRSGRGRAANEPGTRRPAALGLPEPGDASRSPRDSGLRPRVWRLSQRGPHRASSPRRRPSSTGRCAARPRAPGAGSRPPRSSRRARASPCPARRGSAPAPDRPRRAAQDPLVRGPSRRPRPGRTTPAAPGAHTAAPRLAHALPGAIGWLSAHLLGRGHLAREEQRPALQGHELRVGRDPLRAAARRASRAGSRARRPRMSGAPRAR